MHVRVTRHRGAARLTAIAAAGGFLIACGGAAQGAAATPAPAPTNTSGVPTVSDAPWPIKTREHLDLWFHGFAMLQADTTKIPYFRRGYRDQMVVERNRRNISTLLDQNRAALSARFAVNRNLIGAQFVALYFGSWDEMSRAIDLFLQARGDPGRATQQGQQAVIAFLAQSFPSQLDRDWLDLFKRSLTDESSKFYHDYWLGEQRTRAPVLSAVDSVWQQVYRPKLQTFLSRTQQQTGDLDLSLPLQGEGRTVTAGKRDNAVAVAFPDRREVAVEVVYVAAHEFIGAIANTAIADNVTPAERREGVVDRIASNSLVRGGALLLQKTAPELADGYARYYLRAAGLSATGDAQAVLAREFPIPDLIRDAINRQIDSVLGGI
jgi:hypothetical protein